MYSLLNIAEISLKVGSPALEHCTCINLLSVFCKNKLGCFNHRVVTPVADQLHVVMRITLVLETDWKRQAEEQVSNV